MAPTGEGVLLQYVDDLLIATETLNSCREWTVSLLNFLGLKGYKVSQQKAQIMKQEDTYQGYEVSGAVEIRTRMQRDNLPNSSAQDT